MGMKTFGVITSALLLAGCLGSETEFAETPRLEQIKTLASVEPDPSWDFDLLLAYPEANLMVHVELCGKDGSTIHEAAMAKHEAITDEAERDTWMTEYVRTIVMLERQQRGNLRGGSISSRSAVCRRVNDAYEAWQDTGALPNRRFSA